LRNPPRARGPAVVKLKGKGKSKVAERRQSEDGLESDDNVVMPETPIPRVNPRYYVIDTPDEGIVALLLFRLGLIGHSSGNSPFSARTCNNRCGLRRQLSTGSRFHR
jgi:hypothetical protein